MDDRLGLLLQQMEVLTQQNAAMVSELAELRRENAWLRRRLEAQSHFVHQPYASSSGGAMSLLPPPGQAVVPASLGSPRPGTPSGQGGAVQDMVTDSPAKLADPEAKRPRQGGLSSDAI